MASKKNVTKEYASEMTKNKRYVYSWLTDGEGYSDFIISDRLSSINFDVSTSTLGTELRDITLSDGNSSGSYLKTIATGYINLRDEGVTSKNYYSPKSLTVQGVDASAIYGGAVISNSASYSCNTCSYSVGTSRYAGIDAVVTGDANMTVAASTATAVYGGGAGYGSVLDGDVNLKFTSTNRIGTVYGGGQKGAVVNGDVNIVISRADATVGGRIGTVYGGGDSAVVNGNVYITVDGTNAVSVGTISGSGKGNKARVTGDRTLEIVDYSGKFTSNIKDFDTIKITGSSSVVLTQTQNRSIMSAVYEFVLDNEAVSVGQKSAMLTWNKDVDLGQIVITIDADLDNVENGFSKTIYQSSYATANIIDNILVRTRKADGTWAYSSAGTSVYNLEFVADTDSKGKAKAKGGYVVLNYTGSNVTMSDLTTEDQVLSEADEKVSIKGSNSTTTTNGNVVRASLRTMGGDDTVTVQTGTVMAGDIELGEGENTLRVQGNAQVTGAIVVDKNSKNSIYVNGSISQIEGGDATTDNIVYINTPNAVGYYKYSDKLDAATGDQGADYNALDEEMKFIPQSLVFTGESNDTVILSEVATGIPSISFGLGHDMLVLNKSITNNGEDPRITSDGGDVVLVANQTGITIDSSKVNLAGTDNIFVVTNGVKANVTGIAIGAFESKYAGIYLGQNALVDVNGQLAVQSFDGDLFLDKDLTVLKAPAASEELAARIGTYYTAGNGVNADIDANGNAITLRAGTSINGDIDNLQGNTITLLEGATVNGTVIGASDIYFKATAGSEDFLFENDTNEAATIRVAKNAVATVGSINGIAGTTFQGADDFENDSAQVTLNQNAALYAAQDKNLLVGNITKATDFAETYGDKAKGKISVIDEVKARVTFTDADVYVGKRATLEAGIVFKGANKMSVNSEKIVLDNKQISFADDASKVDIDVLDGAELVFDGIEKGGTYSDKINVTLGKNARLAYGEKMRTADWSEEFNAGKLDGRTDVTFEMGALIDNAINLGAATADLTVNISKDALVKGDLTVEDKAVVRLGKGNDTLNVAEATIDGTIYAANDAAGNKDVINLAGSTVNGMAAPKDELAVRINGEDELNLTAKAKVNGDIEALGNADVNVFEGSVVTGSIKGGDKVYVKDSTVEGSINAANGVLNNAKVGAVVGGTTFVESGSTTAKNESEIGTVDATDGSVTVYADVATAKIGAIKGEKGNGNAIALEARNSGTIALQGIDTEVDTFTATAVHAGSAIDFGGDVKLVANTVELYARDGGAFKNLGDVEVAGGITNVSATALTGDLSEATQARIQSADGANITAGDVTFVARNSQIVLEGEGSEHTFGKINQTGTISQNGYGMTTTIANANSASVVAGNATTEEEVKFTADAIEQHADQSSVSFFGTADVAGGIAQTAGTVATVAAEGTLNAAGGIAQEAAVANVSLDGNADVAGGIKQVAATATVDIAGTANVASIEQSDVNILGEVTASDTATVNVTGTLNGAVKQEANAALVDFTYGGFDKTSEVAAVTGAIEQTGIASAQVLADAKIENKYGFEPFSQELEDKNVEKLERTVGAVTQESAANTVTLGAEISADAAYNKAGTLHKAARVNVGSVAIAAGDINQSGGANTVTANLAYAAAGESDVKIGATALEIGKIEQLSDEGTLNKVEITTSQARDDQGVLEVGDIAGKVGAISQKAYRAANEININAGKSADEDLAALNVKIDVDGDISMRAYGGNKATNDLALSGDVTVKGNVNVGGVIEDEHISKDSTWGDKTAFKNTVTIATDTVTLEKDLTLVGLTNELTLNNDSYFQGDATTKQVAQNVYLAGKANTVDVAAGLKMDNIKLYDLEDHDGIGKEGYDLTDGVYNNTLNLRGEAASLELKQKNSNDTINVYGGKIAGDVVTNNGNDALVLGNDGKLIEDAEGVKAARVMGDATVGGNVTMGIKGEASGQNAIAMAAFMARDLVNTDEDVAHNVAIGGDVEMYAGKTDAADAANALVMTGIERVLADGTPTYGTATIGGSVTMVAENAYDATGNVIDQGVNALGMGVLTKIGGDVTMTAYSGNALLIGANEEIVAGESIKEYAEIEGKVAMTAKTNAIGVMRHSAAYMNGVTMANDYVEQDGKGYLIPGSTNVISVGNSNKMIGSELIVGTSVDATADVNMGTITLVKPNATAKTWDVESITKAAKGHDLIKYLDEEQTVVTGMTDTNKIDVTGRFDAQNVTMMASANTIAVQGDGELDKFDLVDAADINERAKVADDVRTASFTAADVTQIAGLKTGAANAITAVGTNNVEHYGHHIDAATGEFEEQLKVLSQVHSVEFTTGAITQQQFGKVGERADVVAVDNTVSLTGSIIAQTGDITQVGEGANAVTVEAFKTVSLDPLQPIVGSVADRSTVGNIAQGTEEFQADSNTVTLTRTDVGTSAGWLVTPGTIDQIAKGSNAVTMTDSTAGAVTQTSTSEDDDWDENSVELKTSTSGTITQTAAQGYNYVDADGGTWDSAKAEYLTSEIEGDIVQTTTQGLIDNWSSNMVFADDTNIAGSISQTGVNENDVEVYGYVNAIDFENDAGEAKQFQKAFDVKVGGDITQKDGHDNEITLTNATVGGKVTQTGTDLNTIIASADTVAAAENKGTRPEAETEDKCEYSDKHGYKTHVTSTVKSQGDFNTLEIKGDIVQTGGVKDADELKALREAGVYSEVPANAVATDNMNLANVTQTQTDGANFLRVNQTFDGTLAKKGEFVGEIDNALNDVTQVADYTVNKTTKIGEIKQTGYADLHGGVDYANNIMMRGVEQAAGVGITQTAVTSALGNATTEGNFLKTTAVRDAVKTIVEVATWDETVKPGDTNKEVFTPTALPGSDNVRAGNKLGAIVQTTDVTGNYAGTDTVFNTIDLANTTVDGAVSQKAVAAEDANVSNEFNAATTAQNFVDVGTDTADKKVKVEYTRTTLDNINGALTQVGFENEASVTNVNVNGDVTQTANMIATTAHHGAQLAGQKAGDNTFTIAGDKNVWADAAEQTAYDAMGLSQNFEIAEVTGHVKQIVNNKGVQVNPDSTSNIEALKASNTVTGTLAKMGDVTQDLTWGNNSVTLTGETIAADVRTPETVDKDHPEVIKAQMQIGSASAKTIAQNAIQEANADGRFDLANAATNTITMTMASAGDVKQTGVGAVSNNVTFNGALDIEKKINETTYLAEDEAFVDQATVNTLGNVTQTAATNAIGATNAKEIGVLTQDAKTYAYTETTTSGTDTIVTTGKRDTYNQVTLTRVDRFGDINQSAESVTYKQVVTTNDVAAEPTDEVSNARNVAWVYSAVPGVMDITTVGGNVKQEVVGTGMTGSNDFYAVNAKLGTIDQTTGDGTNEVWLDTNASHTVDGVTYSSGKITQTGNRNAVMSEDGTIAAITQNGNAFDATDTVSNGVRNVSVRVDAVIEGAASAVDPADKETWQKLNKDEFVSKAIVSGKVEQIAKAVESTEIAGVTGYYDSALTMSNTVGVSIATDYLGGISQTGDANTTNSVDLLGETVQHHKLDEVEGSATRGKVVNDGDPEKINIVGDISQSGLTNSAKMRNYLQAGSIGQKSETYARVTITKDATGKVTSYVTDMSASSLTNVASIVNTATAGDISQTVNAKEFDVKTFNYDDATKAFVEDEALATKATANGDNSVTLEDANVGNVKQEQIGADGYKATGNNTITAIRSDLGNVDQNALDGNNTLTATTASTKKALASKKIGNVSQDGKSNSIVTGDVEIGDIVQNGVMQSSNAMTLIQNTVSMKGVLADDPETKAELADPTQPWDAVTNPHVAKQSELAKTSAKSVTQVSTAKEAAVQVDDVTRIDVKAGLQLNSVSLTSADAGAISQSGTGILLNGVTFDGAVVAAKKVTTDDAEIGNVIVENDTAVPAETPNVLGAIDQLGFYNNIDAQDGAFAADAESGTVAGINQVAQTYDAVVFAEDYETSGKYEAGKVSGFKKAGSFYEAENHIELSNFEAVGAINQQADGGEFDYVEFDGTTATTTKKGVDGYNRLSISNDTNVVGKIKQTATGVYDSDLETASKAYANKVTAEGSWTQSKAVDPAELPYTKDNPQTIEAGAFKNAIGDVNQNLTSLTDTFYSGVVGNLIELSQINAGKLDQIADGLATNNLIVNQGGSLVQIWDVDADGKGFDTGKKAKTEIASATQTGYRNTMSLTDVKIGNITVSATNVDGLTVQEKSAIGKTTVNSITLSSVEVNSITATTEKNEVRVLGVDDVEITFTVYGKTAAILTDTTVVDVTAGNGNDDLTLSGATTVTGTINMGDNSKTAEISKVDDTHYLVTLADGKDTLTVNSADVNISQATIEGVEQFNVNYQNATITVKSIEAENLSYKLPAASNALVTQSAKLGSIENLHSITTADATQDFNATFTAGVGQVRITGSAAKNGTEEGSVIDTLTIGDGVGSDILVDSTIKDMDVVNFAAGAHADANTAYTRTKDTESGNNNIKFTFTFEEGKTDFVLGKFDNVTEAKKTEDTIYSNVDVTLNGLTYNFKDKVWTDGGKAYTDLNEGDKYYTYKDGVVTTHTYTVA